MRVTENRMMQIVANGNGAARSSVAEATRKLNTGLDVQRPSHDPARWADGMRLKSRLAMSGDHKGTVDRSVDKLHATDHALGRVASALIRGRELALQMANATLDAEARALAAVEASGLIDEMVSAANVRGGDGEFLLAGDFGDVAPFDAAGNYAGDEHIREIASGEGQTKIASVPGTVLTAASGVDVFATVATFEAALTANDVAGIQAAIGELSTALEQVSLARGEVGSATAALTITRDALDHFEVQLSGSLEAAVAADPIVAATELANFSNQLQTSRAVADRIVALMNANR